MAMATAGAELIHELKTTNPTEPHSTPTSAPHVAVFPFPSRGHAIPLLHLCAALSHRGLSLTLFSTTGNSPFYQKMLPKNHNINLVNLRFPSWPGLPEGCESTDQLTSMDMFYPFLRATQELCAHFEKALTEILAINPPMALISDAFLYWTLPIATKLGIPRISFMGVDACSTWLFRVIAARGAPLPQGPEILSLPSMPRGKTIKYADVPDGFRGQDPEDPDCVFILEVGTATPHSFGEIVNSFDELEPEFISVLDAGRPRSWCLGPMFLWNDPPPGESPVIKDASCLNWLNIMEKGSVLYVAFGTQARLGESQMREVGLALEGSGASFLWVVRGETGFDDGFEERVKGRGLVVRGWVPQVEVLGHCAIGGFMSHCGWNSVLESLAHGVPILGWPMMAEQRLNASFVEEELGAGIRLVHSEGVSVERVVERGVVELMRGEKGRKARERAGDIKEKAKRAVGEGGSSYNGLNKLTEDISKT